MNIIFSLTKRELVNYFTTPIAYVFIVVFLLLSQAFTFYLGHFFGRNEADLMAFFSFIPWLYVVFIPAITMQSFAQEHKMGTTELLLTLPIATYQVVIAKFIAAWVVSIVALLLTIPLWITVNYLGDPDNGVILAGYMGCLFVSGGFAAVGICLSSLTSNQVIAFVSSVLVCLLFLLCGLPLVLDIFQGFAPLWLLDTISQFSFLTHFASLSKGLLDSRTLVYFVTFIGFWLYANTVILEYKKNAG